MSKAEKLEEFVRRWAKDAESSIKYREKNGRPDVFIWPEFLAKSFKREAEKILAETEEEKNGTAKRISRR